MVVSIRPEQPADAAAIRRVLEAAFPTAAEAHLVELLRAGGHLGISLVAEVDDEIVGHIAFSPVEIEGAAVEGIGIGLAPLAVLPDYQRQGIGGQLVREGLAACERSRIRLRGRAGGAGVLSTLRLHAGRPPGTGE